MNDSTTRAASIRPNVNDRLGELSQALGDLPGGGRRLTSDDPTQRLQNIDEMTARVHSLTQLLAGIDASGWDPIDHVTAQTLLRDLAMIARDLRQVAAAASGGFATAEESLAEITQTLGDIGRDMAVASNAGPSRDDS